MKKLEHDITIEIPDSLLEQAQKEDENVPDIGKITIEIYHDEDKDDETWEAYVIKIPELDDEFDIDIQRYAMEASRQIEEEGGGYVEEFIYAVMMKHINQAAKENEIREFFEDISD